MDWRVALAIYWESLMVPRDFVSLEIPAYNVMNLLSKPITLFVAYEVSSVMIYDQRTVLDLSLEGDNPRLD